MAIETRRTRPLRLEVATFDGNGEPPRKRRSRRWKVLVGLAVVVGVTLVAVGGYGAYMYVHRNDTTVISSADALGHFRDAERAPAVTSTSGALPPEGVYVYRTEGNESISIAGAHHDYPAETFATVRHLGGCQWEFRNEVIAEHLDVRTMCTRDGTLAQVSQAREVEFFGQRDGAEYTCTPPQVQYTDSDAPGATGAVVCSDSGGGEAKIRRTFVGAERLRVGGTNLEVAHLRLHSDTTGLAVGIADDDLWVVPGTGMVVRWQRSVDTNADSVIGDIHYLEDVTFTLASMQPRS